MPESAFSDTGAEAQTAANYNMSEPAANESAAAESAAFTGRGDTNGISSTSAITSAASGNISLDKIIRKIDMDVETLDFDKLIDTVGTQINSLGGYVESANIEGRSYDYRDALRSANIVARVPRQRVDELVNAVADNANVISRNESTKNVTVEYTDTESRIKSLKVEQDRLLDILKETTSLDTIITLEDRMSDVRYQLENYQSQLRLYDNLVEYATVTLNINEVMQITPVQVAKPSTWKRIQTGFGDTMSQIGESLQNCLVWFTVNLPYFLIWAVIIAVVVLIIRKICKKSRRKKQLPPPPPPEPWQDQKQPKSGCR